MIAININVTRIDKTGLYEGKNGKYLALTLHENKGGLDQYGNSGFVTQDLGKDRRQAGEKGAILGNYKVLSQLPQDAHNQSKANGYQPQLPDGRQASPGMPPAPQGGQDDEDDIPF